MRNVAPKSEKKHALLYSKLRRQTRIRTSCNGADHEQCGISDTNQRAQQGVEILAWCLDIADKEQQFALREPDRLPLNGPRSEFLRIDSVGNNAHARGLHTGLVQLARHLLR